MMNKDFKKKKNRRRKKQRNGKVEREHVRKE